MPRYLKIAIVALGVSVAIGLISLRSLRRHMQRLAQTPSSEEQARHEVLAPPISTATDVVVKAKIFWAAGPGKVAPVEVDLPLSADPVQRSRQLLRELISSPPASDQRTIPGDAVLLGFYVLPDGTAIADFSDALASETPSGILSETVAVNSIIRTLASNVPSLRRLRILVHGEEVETLAGHVDLTGFFDLNPGAPLSGTPSAGSAASSGAESAAPPLPAASAAKTSR
ncbi:MAG TPA: GerMN domain-containing protein [Candidatus Polarisedimenticolia bacterium]|nr:GerMN domain-containing protein [Candidatus Polarisedimenticolia bacterium]